MGCIWSTVSAVPLESLDGKGSLSSSAGYILSINLGVVSEVWSILVSLMVTHHLGCIRLDEAAHPWILPSGRITHLLLFLCCPLLLECPWLLKHQQLNDWLWLHCQPLEHGQLKDCSKLNCWLHDVDQWRDFRCPLSMVMMASALWWTSLSLLGPLFWMVAAWLGGNQSGSETAACRGDTMLPPTSWGFV